MSPKKTSFLRPAGAFTSLSRPPLSTPDLQWTADAFRPNHFFCSQSWCTTAEDFKITSAVGACAKMIIRSVDSLTTRLDQRRCQQWHVLICFFTLLLLLTPVNALFTGGLIAGYTKLTSADSPYFIKEHILIERNAQLQIDPGVTMYFRPRKGITVHGTLIAQVSK